MLLKKEKTLSLRIARRFLNIQNVSINRRYQHPLKGGFLITFMIEIAARHQKRVHRREGLQHSMFLNWEKAVSALQV
jgi:hypothetical protein